MFFIFSCIVVPGRICGSDWPTYDCKQMKMTYGTQSIWRKGLLPFASVTQKMRRRFYKYITLTFIYVKHLLQQKRWARKVAMRFDLFVHSRSFVAHICFGFSSQIFNNERC